MPMPQHSPTLNRVPTTSPRMPHVTHKKPEVRRISASDARSLAMVRSLRGNGNGMHGAASMLRQPFNQQTPSAADLSGAGLLMVTTSVRIRECRSMPWSFTNLPSCSLTCARGSCLRIRSADVRDLQPPQRAPATHLASRCLAENGVVNPVLVVPPVHGLVRLSRGL